MNPPAKPTPLHMIAVCAGLIMLFVGTWFLVKKSSPNDETPSSAPVAAPAIVSSPSPVPAPSPIASPAPIPPQESPIPPVEEAKPTPPPPAITMREPDLAIPITPPPAAVPAPAPAPAVEAMAAAPAPPPTPEIPEPIPAASAPSDPPVAIAGPFEIHGPLKPADQPLLVIAPITPDPATVDPNAVPFPPAAESPTQMPMSETGMANNSTNTAPGGIRDVTNSHATDHDMEGDPEDGPVNPKNAVAEKTTDIKPTTSAAMPGWELLNYQSRDYITANSIQRFYRFNNLKVESKNVWFTSPVLIMKANLGSHELLINNIKFVLSYPVVMLNNKPCFSRLDLCKLIDPVLRPSYIGNAKLFDTVVIDPGHGGSDGGARGIYGHEKDFALKLGLLLKRSLEQRGIKVVMTRSTDVFLSLPARVAIANKIPNCIYVSLHYNSGPSTATGIETFALSPQGSSSIYGRRSVDAVAFQGNQLDSENIALATAVHAGVVHHFKLVDRGVKRARWRVLTGLQRPGILFEGGFVTNANDGKLIAADNFRVELANTIAQSIINYRNALKPRARTTTSR